MRTPLPAPPFFPPTRAAGALALLFVLTLAAPGARANATADPFTDLDFAVASDGFNQLNITRITTGQLVAGLPGNVELPALDGGGIFRRTSGSHYPASYGLYSFSGDSTFEVAVADAAAGVGSIVLQTYINISLADGVNGVLSDDYLPRLSYNGGEQFLPATTLVRQSVDGGPGMGGEAQPPSPNNPNYLTFTWDLSSLPAAVDSFKISFGSDNHSQILALQVDQIGAVPEPATLALACAALGYIGLAALRSRAPAA